MYQIENGTTDLINQSQEAFVRGRQLLFNALLCQEMARGYAKKHTLSRCMMKINLKKAYDLVHWESVKEMMISFKFLNIYIA